MTDVIHCLDCSFTAAYQHFLCFEVATNHVLLVLLPKILPFSALPKREDFNMPLLSPILPLAALLAVVPLSLLLDRLLVSVLLAALPSCKMC